MQRRFQSSQRWLRECILIPPLPDRWADAPLTSQPKSQPRIRPSESSRKFDTKKVEFRVHVGGLSDFLNGDLWWTTKPTSKGGPKVEDGCMALYATGFRESNPRLGCHLPCAYVRTPATFHNCWKKLDDIS